VVEGVHQVAASSTFDQAVSARADALTTHLSITRASWWRRLLSADVRAQADPDLRKSLIRIHTDLAVLRRLDGAGSLSDGDRARILELVEPAWESLSATTAADQLQELDLLMIARGDDSVLFPLIKDELGWTRGKTSWLTWDELYGRAPVVGLEEFLDGKPIQDGWREGARNHLLTLKKARYDDQLVHRARQQTRADNLLILSLILLVLIPAFVFLTAVASGSPDLASVLLVPFAGAFGAAMSGAIKARDRMPRAGDIRSFRDGLLAQMLVGAGSAVVVLLAIDSGIVTIAGVTADNWAARAVLGFVGGFSEAFFIGTVERVATLGSSKDASGADQSPGTAGD
jgi:hypothetical protein